jgi:hypothetical protein
MQERQKAHTTNYCNTLIEIADDCPAARGETPPRKAAAKSIAVMQFELIGKHPYRYTSDDVLFLVFAERNGLSEGEYPEARRRMFSRGQACLRSSPLAKRYGWGIHADAEGRVALFGAEADEYKQLQRDAAVRKVKAMRSRR